MVVLSHKFEWQRYPQYYAYLGFAYTSLYIGNLPIKESYEVGPLEESCWIQTPLKDEFF